MPRSAAAGCPLPDSLLHGGKLGIGFEAMQLLMQHVG